MGEEAENAQAVAHADHHNALPGQILAILWRFVRRAGPVAAAIDPHHHRELLLGGSRRRPDVEIEAVLARAGIAEEHVVVDVALHATRAELSRFADTGPVGGGLRRLPP